MADNLNPDKPSTDIADDSNEQADSTQTEQAEYGGPKGKEPTRYGDWEKNGRCIDF